MLYLCGLMLQTKLQLMTKFQLDATKVSEERVLDAGGEDAGIKCLCQSLEETCTIWTVNSGVNKDLILV